MIYGCIRVHKSDRHPPPILALRMFSVPLQYITTATTTTTTTVTTVTIVVVVVVF